MRITARGAGLAGAAVALLGCGFAFGYPELTVLGTAALVAIGFALGYALWRPRLAVTRAVDPDRVMRGEPSRVTLTVRNASRVRGATLVAYDRCGDRTVPVPLLQLRAGRETTTGYAVPTERRGVVRVGPLRVVRRDPLGLLSLARGYGEVTNVWVYPKVHHLTAVPVGVVRSLDGRVDRVPQGSITFDTLREYVVGDELRHVHWRTTARIGQLMVREHVDTSLPRLVVLLDDRAAAHPEAAGGTAESFEAACEAAASIVMAATRAELPIALQLIRGGAVGGDGRHGHPRPYLDLLTEAALGSSPSGGGTADQGPSRDLLGLATAGLRHRRIGDTLIYLTGPEGRGDLGRIGALRGLYPTIVVAAFGAADPAPSTEDGLLVLAAADGADFATAWDGIGTW
ncbi:MAG TPA: DUF58 domain-containing protein [Micromonosporaceae bacterium]|nr:DUF58 domain-containing protein [Micromonosporaceae bacterium]